MARERVAGAQRGEVEFNPGNLDEQNFSRGEIEGAARTLIKAEEITQNKQLYALALKEMERQQWAMARAMNTSEGKTLRDMLNKSEAED